MINKRILLVEDNYDDIISIQDTICNIDGQHSLHVVHNLRDALQVLMGGSSQYSLENYTQTGKVRPDIVLMNINFLQESAYDFLEVINKYYTLKNIRVFIIGDSTQKLDHELAARYGIAGYLTKPLDLENSLDDSVMKFRKELDKTGKALFSLTFLMFNREMSAIFHYLKIKTVLFTGKTVAAKIAVSAVASVFAASMLSSSTSGPIAYYDDTSTSSEAVAALPKSPAPQPTENCVEEKTVATIKNITVKRVSEPLKKAIIKQPTAETVEIVHAEETVVTETVAPPKNYRIVAVEEADSL